MGIYGIYNTLTGRHQVDLSREEAYAYMETDAVPQDAIIRLCDDGLYRFTATGKVAPTERELASAAPGAVTRPWK